VAVNQLNARSRLRWRFSGRSNSRFVYLASSMSETRQPLYHAGLQKVMTMPKMSFWTDREGRVRPHTKRSPEAERRRWAKRFARKPRVRRIYVHRSPEEWKQEALEAVKRLPSGTPVTRKWLAGQLRCGNNKAGEMLHFLATSGYVILGGPRRPSVKR